ncbi:MAG: LysE family translocator [Gammaproteobacteria bacterium]
MPIALPTAALLTFGAYALATASPGPSNLAVMATAMNGGRKPALVFALGVVAGSTLWGVLAALGLSVILARWAQALVAIKVLGGLYLLWLASKAARRAWRVHAEADQHVVTGSNRVLFMRGLAMHLTNPKAIFNWLSLVTLALPSGAGRTDALMIVAGCVPIGLAVFCGYALVFSTGPARAAYLRLRRWIDGGLAALFGYAGMRMLFARAA